MRVQVSYKNLEPSKKIQRYASERLSKAAKFMLKAGRAELHLTKEGRLYHVELTLIDGGKPLHSTVTHENLFAAIEAATDKVQRQALKVKKRIQHHKNFEKSREGRMLRLNEKLEAEYMDYDAWDEDYSKAA